MKIFLSLLLIILSMIGIADSSLITYDKLSGVVPDCGVGFDCGAVLNSEWSSIGPIPLSLLGLFFYLTVFTLSILNYLDFDIKKITLKLSKRLKLKKNNILLLITTQELILLVTIFGALFSAYLVFLMAVIIEAWCKYCLISAFTSFTLFLVSSKLYLKYQKNSPFLLKKIIISVEHFLYVNIVKKIFFLFDAEDMHNFHTKLGKDLGSSKLLQKLTSIIFSFSHKKLEQTIDGVTFKNPVGLSAGFDYNGELTGILPSVGFGFHTIGTVTYHPYEGNKKPRLGRLLKSKSLVVNKGFKSLGAKTIAKKLSRIKFSIPTGISIGSTNKYYKSSKEQITDILKTFSIFEKSKVNHLYYELNISCPNTFGGEPFTNPKKLELLLASLENLKISKPIYVKMPIDQSKKATLLMLRIVDKFHIAGVIFGNLTKDKKNPDVNKEDQKKWKKIKGNLSGKPTWNRSNELIKLTRENFKNRFTIIGTGGVFTGEDAIKKMELGADLVQIITGMIFEGPQVLGDMNLKLAQKALNKGTKRVGHNSSN
jgi:dihydroorotate dehydrogenase